MSTQRHTGLALSRRRRIARVVSAIGTAALTGGLLALSACSDAPSGPLPSVQGPNTSLTSTLTSTVTGTLTTVTSTVGTLVNGLTWSTNVGQTSASATIGPEGGTVSIPNGVRVTFPAGALSATTKITVTRLPGSIVAYDFQPHGTKFAQPVLVEHPTSGTNILKLPALTSFQGAYFQDQSLLNQLLGTVTVSEFEPTFVSADKAWVRFTVQHFSGYVVAWGRQ